MPRMRRNRSSIAVAIQPAVRCAVYCRVSTDERLGQEFNSLDAQREACEAFVQSQKNEGWSIVRKRYDDGGFSGGSMDRPALQTLMADIEHGTPDERVIAFLIKPS